MDVYMFLEEYQDSSKPSIVFTWKETYSKHSYIVDNRRLLINSIIWLVSGELVESDIRQDYIVTCINLLE